MIPIGGSPTPQRFPWVTYSLIAANLVVFLYMLAIAAGPDLSESGMREQRVDCYGFATPPTQVDHFYCRWGFQPREFIDVARNDIDPQIDGVSRVEVLLSLLTSMFVHAGWLHVAGNMLFLWVFGGNVESRLGHIRFLLFYLVAGLAATGTQTAVDVNSLVPVVGASGAVSAVLGAYLLLHPGSTVRVLMPLWMVLVPIRVPAVLMIGLWFVQNVLAGYAEFSAGTTAGSGVAYFAHIGGFVFGVIVGLFLGAGSDQPPAHRTPIAMRPGGRPPF